MALSIDSLRVVPTNIQPGENTRVMFSLSQPATLTAEMQTLNGTTVTSLLSNAHYPPGQYSLSWDTPADLRGGYYTPVITATDTSGESVTEKIPVRTSKMIPVEYTTQKTLSDTTEIAYTLPQPGLVSVRVGINNGPLYKNLVNWELAAAGTHSIQWDGWDNDSVFRVDKLSNYHIDVRYIPVECNALYVASKKGAPPVSITAPELLRQIHAFVPQFSVATDAKTNTGGNNEIITLKMTVDPDTLQKLQDIPYEYVLYINGERYGEIEQGTSPCYWDVSTHTLTPGEHIFTVMLCTSIEQINSRSFKVQL